MFKQLLNECQTCENLFAWKKYTYTCIAIIYRVLINIVVINAFIKDGYWKDHLRLPKFVCRNVWYYAKKDSYCQWLT